MMNEPLEDIVNKIKEAFVSTSQNTKDMRGMNYYIGKGILQWDNVCIQIRNIVVISKYREAKKSLAVMIAMIVCGFFFMMIPLDFFRVLGAYAILIGVLFIVLTLHNNKKRMFRITIKMTSGDRFTIEDKREEFIEQIMLVLKNSMMDDGKSYFIALNSGIIQCSDNGGINSVGDENWHTVFNAGASKETSREKTSDEKAQKNDGTQIEVADMTVEDWEQIKKFTERVIMEETQNKKLVDNLMQLRTFIIKRDETEVEKKLRAMEKEQLMQFLNNAQNQQEKSKIMVIVKKIVNSNRRVR